MIRGAPGGIYTQYEDTDVSTSNLGQWGSAPILELELEQPQWPG